MSILSSIACPTFFHSRSHELHEETDTLDNEVRNACSLAPIDAKVIITEMLLRVRSLFFAPLEATSVSLSALLLPLRDRGNFASLLLRHAQQASLGPGRHL